MIDIKSYLSRGIKSGVLAGIFGAVLFGIYLTLVVLLTSQNFSSILVIFPYSMLGLPIGLLFGAICGLGISYIVAKNDNIFPHIKILSVGMGSLAGIFYPLCLLVALIFFQETGNPQELQNAILVLFGGLFSGAIAGLIGCEFFLRFLNK